MLNKIIQISSNSVFDCWSIGRSTLLLGNCGYSVHGQVLTTWFVFAIIATIAFAGNSNLKAIPEGYRT
jgi:hypothetical protein